MLSVTSAFNGTAGILDLPQDHVARSLAAALRNGRVGHAYLFVGTPGLGQERAAAALVSALVCTERGEAVGPCGRCRACRKQAAGNHADVHWIRPDGASVKREQITGVRRELGLRPTESGYRCFVLVGADRLTAEAANHLLKSLEEPPPDTVLILLTRDEGLLPETIVSRCQRFSFRTLDPTTAAPELARDLELGLSQALDLARLAGGNPGRARELHERGALGALSDQARQALGRIAGGDPLQALEAAGEIASAGKDDALLVLDLMEAALRDAWIVAAGVPSSLLIRQETGGASTELAGVLGRFDYEDAARAFNQARARLNHHLQLQPVLDSLCLGLQQLV